MEERVEKWIEQAEKDLETAENLFEAEDFEPMIFRLQQAVEKIFKAFHIKKTGEYPYTHNLRKLNTKINVPKDFENLLSELDASYTTSRYPETAEELQIENPDKKLSQTKEIIKWIKKQLKK